MTRPRFTAAELAARLGCALEGDGARALDDVAAVEDAGAEHVTFLANLRYRNALAASSAGAVIIAAAETSPAGMVRLVSAQPYNDFRRAQELFHPAREPDVALGVHLTALVDATAKLGPGVRVGPFVQVLAGAVVGAGCILHKGAYVGRDSVLGEACELGVNAVVRHECRLGNRVVIGDNSVVGFDGFGYAPDEKGEYHKIPQAGTVELADDVELGACTCVDRGALGPTRIGKGTKLDNFVQVGHGAQVGEHTIMCGASGVAGSGRIGNHVVIAGQAGVSGHITVGDHSFVGGQAGVSKSVPPHGNVRGSPARPFKEQLRQEAAQARVPDLLQRVKELEKQLAALTGKAGK